MRRKNKLKIVVDQAGYFLKWELPYFRNEFELVADPADDAILLAFGPDVLESSISLPALKRTAVLFPGFGFNPYHDNQSRMRLRSLVEGFYDLIFVNPGPIDEALKGCQKVVSHPFSVDVETILKFKRVRNSIDSLLHVSAPAPQKDWERSAGIMELTGLRNEVYPAREVPESYTLKERLKWRYNKYVTRRVDPIKAFRTKIGYVEHVSVIRKYVEYDAFVHVAAEIPLQAHIDGKYTAALLEAGVSGSIIFWHDTLGLGNDFETIFPLPKNVRDAANEILSIRSNVDIEKQSRATSEEIADRCHPQRIVEHRRRSIDKLI